MDKIRRNRIIGFGLIILGIIGFSSLYLTKNEFLVLSGFVLPLGIYFILKTLKNGKSKQDYIFGGSLLFFMSLALIMNDFNENNELSNYGIITQGWIIDKKSRSSKYGYEYITYDFCDQDGNYHRATQNCNISKYNKKDTVDVIYSQRDINVSYCSHQIDSKPKRWSFINAIWESKFGVKVIALCILIGFGTIFIICSTILILLKILVWIITILT